MYPYIFTYWPKPYEENEWVRIEVLAKDDEDANKRFHELNLDFAYYTVHEPVLED